MHFRYLEWDDRFATGKKQGSPFDKLWDLFQQLLMISGGDVDQALHWLTELDREYDLTDDDDDGYSLSDFIEELEKRGYLNRDDNGGLSMTAKSERTLRQSAFEEIFRNLQKGGPGGHKTPFSGSGLERQPESRQWQQGDDLGHLDSTGTMMNMLRHSSIDNMELREDDLQVYETDHHTSVATVLLIDVSHSMILYGEDRITPARKVAMGLSELILNHYAKDSLDIIAFGNEAWEVQIEDLPYLQVGPYHTNTLQALEKARHILQHRKYTNKQIFMITDGKPSCMIQGNRIYKNSFGLDRRIINKVLDEAVKCRREQIPITTFMIARDPYLQDFVRKLTKANHGRAYYAALDELGGYMFEDYIRNRRKRTR